MSIVDELKARGLYANCTDREGLAELLSKEAPVAAYAGYDPTAAGLHVGNLVPTILLKRLQLAGHRPIIVVGGATGMIGDPSGKSDERNLLDDATRSRRTSPAFGAASAAARLRRRATTGALMTNNADWTRGVELPRVPARRRQVPHRQLHDGEGLGESAPRRRQRHQLHRVLVHAAAGVRLRRAPRSHGCRLQVGGNDQYGNITAGCELQRKLGRPPSLRSDRAAAARLDRPEDGQDVDGRAHLARAPSARRRSSSTSTGSTPRRRGAALLGLFSLRPLAELEELSPRTSRIAQAHSRNASSHAR